MGNNNSSPGGQGETIIVSNTSEMAKHFVRENAIIWHDPNVNSTENTKYINELKNICDVQGFVDWNQASEYLKKETQLSCCQIITSGTNGELFVKDISDLPYISSIYVFCGNVNYHKTWAQKYSKVVCVENNFDLVFDKIKKSMIKWQRTSSSLRVNLPSFASIFDDADLSEMNYLHFYLKEFINFENREQAKTDFLTLAKTLYGKNQDIEEFEKSYTQYDMKTILNWYTKESFLYKLTNNCLKIANSASIEYCRLILKDLETAIKDQYRQQSNKFSGRLYRGTYLSDDEWKRLEKNTNKDIEMYGFLSTTKQKDQALDFCKTDMEKKAMITIIVPNFPEKEEQGFAELKEYSSFTEEDEVLFNARSRFTILEASVEEIDGVKIRHLILLYGAQAMRSFTSLQNPSIELQINVTQTTECQVCKQTIKLGEISVVTVSISNSNEYLCRDCRQQSHITQNFVLLCLSSAAHGKVINRKIEGTVLPYQGNLNVPFYGYSCAFCQETKLKRCYKCLDCKNARRVYCNGCFHDKKRNSCISKKHVMLLQANPYSFWSDKMTENEVLQLKNQEKEFEEIKLGKNGDGDDDGDSKDLQAAVSYHRLGNDYDSSGQYQKAIEYHSKALEIYKIVHGDKHPTTASCYNNLGGAYESFGQYQKAIEYCTKALEICKTALGEKHASTANCYNNLGSVYSRLGEYQKAVEYHTKALEIRKTVLGDKHPDFGSSLENLGITYKDLGEYQKAIKYSTDALDTWKRVLGDKHAGAASSYNTLGSAYWSLGESRILFQSP